MSRCGKGWNRRGQDGYLNVKTFAMRRALALSNESARHPFRATLPASATAEPLRESFIERKMPDLAEDVRGFAIAYVACFLAVAVFIF